MEQRIKIGKDPAVDDTINGLNFVVNQNDEYTSRHHAHLDVISTNPLRMNLTSKSPNKTFLNGVPVIRDKQYPVKVDDIIQLVDNQRNPIKVSDVLAFANISTPTADKPVAKRYTADFEQLKEIYDTYTIESAKLSKKEALINGLRGVVFALGGASAVLLGFVAKEDGADTQILKACIPVVVILVVTLILNKLNPKEKSSKLLEKFKIDYVCPNHKCSHSFYGSPWELLARPGQCRVCKTSWIEEDKKINFKHF